MKRNKIKLINGEIKSYERWLKRGRGWDTKNLTLVLYRHRSGVIHILTRDCSEINVHYSWFFSKRYLRAYQELYLLQWLKCFLILNYSLVHTADLINWYTYKIVSFTFTVILEQMEINFWNLLYTTMTCPWLHKDDVPLADGEAFNNYYIKPC